MALRRKSPANVVDITPKPPKKAASNITMRIACKTRDDVEDCVNNVATCFWISANVVWMVGEFYLAGLRPSFA